jgi:hypothetical protein
VFGVWAASTECRRVSWSRSIATTRVGDDFRGVLETDDGATVLVAWHSYAIPRPA